MPIFKQGKDWLLSIGGLASQAVKTGVNLAAEGVTTLIGNAIDEFSQKVETATNTAIYKAYQAASTAGGNALDAGRAAATGTIDQWSANVQSGMDTLKNDAKAAEAYDLSDTAVDNGAQVLGDAVNSISGTVNGEINRVFGQAGNYLDGLMASTADQAAILTSKAIKNTTNAVKNKANSVINGAAAKLVDNVTGFITDKLPLGEVVNTGSSETNPLDMDYMGYIRIFLFIMSGEKKVQNIQRLIQANMRYGMGQNNISGTFSMAGSFGGVSATLDVSTKYLFMTEAIVGRLYENNKIGEWSPEGGMVFTVYSDITY